MKIVHSEPPMIAEIEARFPKRPPGVIYAFGDTIYNPSGQYLPPAIVAHEAEHGRRQKAMGPGAKAVTQYSGVELWWRKYLEDFEFRYREEVYAHAAEMQAQWGKDRNQNARLLRQTAQRLLAPFYEYPPSMNGLVPEATLKLAMRRLQQ